MHRITGMESLSFKMVSILFIVILNITYLSSQTSDPNGKTEAFTYVAVNSLQVSKPAVMVSRAKVYTVYIARTFPTLQCNSNQKLIAMIDSETLDYNELFSESLSSHNVTFVKSTSFEPNRSTKKHSKTKVAPKLNL